MTSTQTQDEEFYESFITAFNELVRTKSRIDTAVKDGGVETMTGAIKIRKAIDRFRSTIRELEGKWDEDVDAAYSATSVSDDIPVSTSSSEGEVVNGGAQERSSGSDWNVNVIVEAVEKLGKMQEDLHRELHAGRSEEEKERHEGLVAELRAMHCSFKGKKGSGCFSDEYV